MHVLLPSFTKLNMLWTKSFKTLFWVKFIAYSVLTSSSLIYENYDFEDRLDKDNCLDLARSFTSATLIFCDLEPSYSILESLMNKNIPINIIANNISYNISGNLSYGYKQKKVPNFIVFSGLTAQGTGDCLLSTTHDDLLTTNAKLIICDVSGNDSVSPLLQPDAWWTVGSANVLYIAKSHCWALSPPHLFDRQFSRVSRCEGLQDFWRPDQSFPDLQGQMVQAVSFHRPVTTIIKANETDPDRRYDGVEINIFKVIAEQLNFTWRLNELENETDKWGQFLDGGYWKGGMMEALTTGGAEVGFATLWVSPMQTPYLDYTTSWMTVSDFYDKFREIESIFVVPKPVLVDNSFSTLLRPFSSAVWVGVSTALLLFPLAIWTSLRLHTSIFHAAHNSAFSIFQSFLYTVGTITGGSGRLADGGRHRPATRPLVTCWYMFVLLLCNCYNSNIVVDLTLPLFTTKINTVRQLVEQGFSWGRTHPEDTLEKHLDFQKYWHRKFAENFIVYKQSDEKRLILAGKFAHSAQQIKDTNYLLFDLPLEEDLARMLRVMKEIIRSYRCAIAVRKNSPLLSSMNAVVARMVETGLVQYIKDDSIRRFRNPTYDKIVLDLNTGFSSDATALTMDHYKYMFFILIIGWISASLCFIFELFIHAVYSHWFY